MAILEQLEGHQKDIKSMREQFEGFGSKLERIEKLLSSRQSSSNIGPDTKPGREQYSPPKPVPMSSQKHIIVQSTSTSTRETKMHDESPSSSFHQSSSDSGGNENIPSVAKQNAIHIEHNTAAQKLFRWPAIKALLQKCKKLGFNESTESYVLDFELKKGPLHLYGRGQGQDIIDAASMGLSAGSPAGSAHSGPSDDASEGSSPASSVDLPWGHGLNPFVSDSSRDSVTGGVCADNTLKVDSKTINNLHQSYMQHMQILHPILDETVLTKLIENFKKRYSTSPESNSSKIAFAMPVSNVNVDALRDTSNPFNKPIKRKHSDSQYWADPSLGQVPITPRHVLERSPATAVVLLVLALGKICECREPLSGPTHTKENTLSSAPPYSPAFRTDSPPPHSIRHSPSAYSATASPMGLARQNHLSPRSSVGELPPRYNKNFDIIPGLAYYAQATDILGNMTGSHDITYVQCCLLAGLYAGQLANAVESLTWIQYAARGCCILTRE